MELSFTDYTATAQTSLVSAAQEAAAMHSTHIEPEHLLLALLTPEAGTAWSVLSGKMRNPVLLREGVKIALVDDERGESSTPPIYSFRTDRALREAQDEARRAGHGQVDTSHLLLGLLDEGGTAGQMLRRQGLDAQWLRHWLRQPRLVEAPPAAPSPAPAKQDAYAGKPLVQVLPQLISWPAVIILFGALLIGGWLTTRSDYNQARAGLIVIVLAGWIISLCSHEFAHAFIADLGGDTSVRANGYLSFNPIKYTHFMLSIVLPIIFVLLGGIGLPGGAVYIDRTRVRGPKWESAISLAGPTASMLMTVIFAVPFLLGLDTLENIRETPMLWEALGMLVMLNAAAAVLNLLPIPPLDGFGVIAPWLTPNIRTALYGLSSMGVFVVFLLLSTNATINGIFWGTVYNLMRSLRVPPGSAELGLQAFMFWRPS